LTETLARFHAWSYIKFNDENGNGEHHKLPSIQDRLEMWKELWCSCTPELLHQTKLDFPEVLGKIPEDKLLKLLSVESFEQIYGINSRKDKLPVVLVHGDMQPMNILWSKQGDDPNRLVGVVDLQMAHRGYGPEDLGRMISYCCTAEMKQKHIDDILRRYVEVFNEKIKGTGLKTIRFEDVKSVFDPAYAFMALNFVLAVRVVDQFFEKIENEDEREKAKKKFMTDTAAICEDAMVTLGWL